MFVLTDLILEELATSKISTLHVYYCSHINQLAKTGAELALGNLAKLITCIG